MASLLLTETKTPPPPIDLSYLEILKPSGNTSDETKELSK